MTANLNSNSDNKQPKKKFPRAKPFQPLTGGDEISVSDSETSMQLPKITPQLKATSTSTINAFSSKKPMHKKRSTDDETDCQKSVLQKLDNTVIKVFPYSSFDKKIEIYRLNRLEEPLHYRRILERNSVGNQHSSRKSGLHELCATEQLCVLT